MNLEPRPHLSLLSKDVTRNGGIVFLNPGNKICRVSNYVFIAVKKPVADFLILDYILETPNQYRVKLTCYAISIRNSGFRPNGLGERFAVRARDLWLWL